MACRRAPIFLAGVAILIAGCSARPKANVVIARVNVVDVVEGRVLPSPEE